MEKALYESKNKHKIENKVLNKYENPQKIDNVKIKIELCKDNINSNAHNIFNRYNTWKKNICELCQSNHDKSHKIINYDDKHYIGWKT